MKKASFWFFSFLGLAAFSAVAVALGDYSWRNRPLLVFAENAGNVRLAKQVAIVRRNKRVLKDGETVAILIDQNVPREDGIFIEYFGQPAATTPVAAMAAMRRTVLTRIRTQSSSIPRGTPMDLQRSP